MDVKNVQRQQVDKRNLAEQAFSLATKKEDWVKVISESYISNVRRMTDLISKMLKTMPPRGGHRPWVL